MDPDKTLEEENKNEKSWQLKNGCAKKLEVWKYRAENFEWIIRNKYYCGKKMCFKNLWLNSNESQNSARI